MQDKLVVILGATATGKTNCGIELAKLVNGEIISGDSMYVYKEMNIGTAKPSAEELSEVKHHLVDILAPDAEFSVVDFKIEAEKLIKEINAQGKIPILVGGTGLYIKALLEDYQFNEVSENTDLREELEAFAEANGNEALHDKLKKLDLQAAEKLHSNDRRRVIRAIEAALEGDTVSEISSGEPVYDAVVFGLNMEREKLYDRINKRVDIMLSEGLEKEVKLLLEQGLTENNLSMKSIGYRQMLQYLQGEFDVTTAIAKIKQATRNFAKRQITWYKKMPYVKWYEINDEKDYETIVKSMHRILVEKYKLL